MTDSKRVTTVADVLEQALEPTINDWQRRVNEVPTLTNIALSDEDRTGHLPKLYFDLICRLRLAKDAKPPRSATTAAHGRLRRAQGYSASMLVEESRVFQVATFGALRLHQDELDQSELLSDIMVIADEVDAQLEETVRGFSMAEPAANLLINLPPELQAT